MRACDVVLVAFTLAPETNDTLLAALQALCADVERPHDAPRRPVVVLVRTRCDLPADMAALAPVLQWAVANDMPLIATSALTGENVDICFEICTRVHLLTQQRLKSAQVIKRD